MATVARNPDDEEQAPSLSGGVGPSPMTQGAQKPATAAGGSPMQPQRSAMQGTGSNFVNLQSFLSPEVAKQNQAKVQTLGNELQTKERQTFDKAADPLRQATFSPLTGSARQLVDQIVPQKPASSPQVPPGGYHDPKTGQTWSAKDPKTGARTEVKMGGGSNTPQPDAAAKTASLSQLQAMLTQDFTGPTSVDYDANNANAQRLGMLGNTDTALNALAPDSFAGNLPRSQGNNWLDNAMLQSDAGTMGALGAVKSGAESFKKQTADEKAALEGKVKGFKDEAAKARDKARGELKGYGDELLGGIDKRIGEANAKEEADRAGNVLRDPTTGAAVSMPGINQEQTSNWEAGTGASRGNMSNDTERGRLSQIAQLLGMSDYDVGPAGQYQSGRYTTSTVPGAMQPRAINEDEALRGAGMGSAQKAKYDEYRAKGMSVDEAIRMAKADNMLTVKSVKG